MIIVDILKNIITPLLLLMSVGFYLNRIFSFDVNTLAKLNVYFYIPVVIFTKIYETSLNFNILFLILLFLIIQVIILFFISHFIATISSFSTGIRSNFVNSVVLNNQGNFGLPVNTLAFNHDPLAMSVQIIVMAVQNFLTFSLGVINVKSSNGGSFLQGLVDYFKSPIFIALLLGMLGNMLNFPIPQFIKNPVWAIADGFFVFALITFGAQITFKNLKGYHVPLALSMILRLIASPFIAFVIIKLLNLNGIIAASLLISSAMPASRNSAIIALEYKNHPEFAAQTVLFSTLLGSLTITFVIYFAKLYFL